MLNVYYSRALPGSLVVEAQGELSIVPMQWNGWASRYPYLGHRKALVQVPAHEGDIQLRTTGWVPEMEHLDGLSRELARLDPGGAVANPHDIPGTARISDGNAEVMVMLVPETVAALAALPTEASHEYLWDVLCALEMTKCDGCGLMYAYGEGRDNKQGSRVCRSCQKAADREDATVAEHGTLFPG